MFKSKQISKASAMAYDLFPEESMQKEILRSTGSEFDPVSTQHEGEHADTSKKINGICALRERLVDEAVPLRSVKVGVTNFKVQDSDTICSKLVYTKLHSHYLP